MATYTYDDFLRARDSAGMQNGFSEADLRLAQSNPDAGMSILKYKQDWQNATTDEARALANMGAEGIRSSYGNYTAGGDGNGFRLNQQVLTGSFGTQPEYTNRYDATIQELLDGIVNREKFNYDPETDPLYSQYRKQYAREGQRATQNALGAAAAATGGIPSSYAATAAAQAGDYYAAQMTDKIPELYELAYNKYLNDYDMALKGLGAVQGAEQYDYAKYLDNINNRAALRAEALDMAQLAAKYGDYEQLKRLGIDPEATGKVKAAGSTTGGPGDSTTSDDSTVTDGDTKGTAVSDNLGHALQAYLRARNITPDTYADKGSGGALPDEASALELGYGNITADELNQLIKDGYVEEYIENGKIKFRRTGKDRSVVGIMPVPKFKDAVM